MLQLRQSAQRNKEDSTWLKQSNAHTAARSAPRFGSRRSPMNSVNASPAEICQPCWSGWLQKQTQIINHYGLDLTNPDAQNFLFDNIKGYLFGDVPKVRRNRHNKRRIC